jgi:ArsR family transcriptional regulator, arsenate/arsenite/antimonite-responsive transcriptional repressor
LRQSPDPSGPQNQLRFILAEELDNLLNKSVIPANAQEMKAYNAVLKALADPTRREILRLLSGGERTAGELASSFDMTKPSMSHHFAVLKEADLIHSRRDGQQIYYALNTTVLEDVLTRLWDHLGLKNSNGND